MCDKTPLQGKIALETIEHSYAAKIVRRFDCCEMPGNGEGNMSRLVYIPVLMLFCIIRGPVALGSGIHDAAAKGDLEAVKSLVAKNPATVSARDAYSQTPLHVAADRGHFEVVVFLLEQGADVNARAYNQFTPLHLASDPHIVKAILRRKPDLAARDSGPIQTPLERADSKVADGVRPVGQWREIVDLLLHAGASYDIQSAIYLNDVDRVRTLLKEDPSLADDCHGALECPAADCCKGGAG